MSMINHQPTTVFKGGMSRANVLFGRPSSAVERPSTEALVHLLEFKRWVHTVVAQPAHALAHAPPDH